MRIRFDKLSDGPGPSEMMVAVQTSGGHQEQVVVSKRQAQSGGIEVGAPLSAEGDKYLIELPREAHSGRWRVWIDRNQIVAPAEAAE